MKILFYSLNAAIWQHAIPESRLVKELTQQGIETVYVSCGKTFFPTHCTSYSAYGVQPSSPTVIKGALCKTCVRNAKTLTAGNGARHVALKAHLTAEDERLVDETMKVVTPKNYMEFEFNGVEVGKAVTYELFLLYKKMSLVLTADEWEYYQIYLRNCLLSLIGFSRIFLREKPDSVFFYSPQYGVNGVCAQFAIQQGAKAYFVEGSSSNAERYEALRIWDWNVHGLVNPGLAHWQDVHGKIEAEDLRRVTGHFSELILAKSYAVYSAPASNQFSARKHFRVPAGAKLALATLSSYDEAYAAFVIGKFPARKVKSPVFRDQFEWIKKTIAYVAERPDIFLIVRVHPRDYPNKRDARQSEQAALWENMFQSLPSNIVINWPQDQISLYDIFREVDAVLTGWSATGTEAMVFGIPVVTYDRHLPSYPPDIHFTGETEEEYYGNIERVLQHDRTFDNAVKAYEWLAASFSLGTVRIPKAYMIGEKWPRALPLRILRRGLNMIFMPLMRRIDARRAFENREDAERFMDLAVNKRPSLYDAIVSGGFRKEMPSQENLRQIVNNEVRIFMDPT